MNPRTFLVLMVPPLQLLLCLATPIRKMGWLATVKVLLIILVLSKWPLVADTLPQKASVPGMPLSDVEYEHFFKTSQQALYASCTRRATSGCEDPVIRSLDQYENHGIIPDGWICSDFSDNTSFPSFCDFALYRCIMKKYFAKRVLCPEEIMKYSTVTQNNRAVIPDNIVLSTKETTKGPSPEDTPTTETAATEIAPTSLHSTTAEESLLEIISTVEMISEGLDATSTEPSSELTSTRTTELFMELNPTSTAATTPESSSKLATTSTTTDEFLVELLSTSATVMEEPESSPATTTTESPSGLASIAAPEQTTTTAPTESSSTLTTATEFFPESLSDTAESLLTPTTHTTTSTTASNTEPCIVDYPDPFSTSETSTSSADTAPTSSASPTTILPTTQTKSTTISSKSTASPQPLVPSTTISFLAPLPLPPPPLNGTMHILILSFIGNKNVKAGNGVGISALPQTGLGPGNVLQPEEMQNLLPATGLKELFFRLRDKSVQQLMHKIKNEMPGGKQKPQLPQSSSLQLLSALNTRSDFKSRLQR